MDTSAFTSAPVPVRVPFGSVAPGLEFDLRLFREGDDALFADLDRRLRPYLDPVVRRWARDPDHADDLKQMTMIRVYEKRASYAGKGSLLAWTWSICENVCREDGRRSGTVATVALEDCEDLLDGAPLADEEIERRRRTTIVRRALANLDKREREAVLAHWGEGRSLAEVARAMGINVCTAAELVRRGVERLACMEELAEAALDEA